MSESVPWSREEVEAIVADYLHMLTLELSGQSYVKSAHRQALKQRLHDRSDGSIERKHQNISAVMLELGCPYIAGYKPLMNYQGLLLDIVSERLGADRQFDLSAAAAAEQPAAAPMQIEFDALLTEAPVLAATGVREPAAKYTWSSPVVQRDYLAREARNRSLGTAGEELVAAFEQYRLYTVGKKQLSERVEHVAATRGDGLGYDVLSFDTDGRERFIEVKTTSFGKETPFFLSANELRLSKEAEDKFHLYRLFDFRKHPRLFDLRGAVDAHCQLDPVSYVVRF